MSPVEDGGEHADAIVVADDEQTQAGERLRARFTTFGARPVSLYSRTMRTVSAAIASCAWSVDAPM